MVPWEGWDWGGASGVLCRWRERAPPTFQRVYEQRARKGKRPVIQYLPLAVLSLRGAPGQRRYGVA